MKAKRLKGADMLLAEASVTATENTIMAAVLADLGCDASPIGVPFCSDASKFGAIGIPSMILGPGSIDQAHAAIEFVDCQQVIAAAEIYRQFMIQFDPSH